MIAWLSEQIGAAMQGNQFFQGGIVLMVMGGMVAWARHLPHAAWDLFLRYYTTEMEIRNPEVVSHMAEWLSGQPYGRRCRKTLAVYTYAHPDPGEDPDDEKDRRRLTLAPGLGIHLLRIRGRVFWLEREVEKTDNDVWALPIEKIRLRTWGRSRKPLETICADVLALVKSKERRRNPAYVSTKHGNWERVGAVADRAMDSVVLVDGLAEDLVDDIRRFLGRRDWYHERGIPYRRGYLLHGAPGNGKSSVVQAIASEFRLPLYVLNIREKDFGDRGLAVAFASLPPRAVVLLEDVDCVQPARDQGAEAERVTMSGLLNAIDGALASEGRLLFLTTNRPEILDSALVRPGRVDRRFHLDNATAEQAERLFLRFFPAGRAGIAARFGEVAAGMSMAALQEYLIDHAEGEPADALAQWHAHAVAMERVA